MRSPLMAGRLVLAGLLAWGVGTAPGAELDETARSAVYLLQASMKVRRQAQANRAALMLRALRQLADPELKPLFLHMLEQDDALLGVHGILGLAECQSPPRLDLARFRRLAKPAIQQVALAAATDLDLVDVAAARDLMEDAKLTSAVRVVAAAHLQRHNESPDAVLLQEAAGGDALDVAALAALVLLQRGDPAGLASLNRLNASTEPVRDTVRQNLLQTALAWEFDRIGPWALALAADPATESRLGRLALQAALRFGAPGAADLWRKRFGAAADLVQRTRVALVALHSAHWVDPALFAPLARSEDTALATIGRAGAAVAARRDVVSAVVAAIEAGQPSINQWALEYARRTASPADAPQILLALVLAFDGDEQGSARRLQFVIGATEALADLGPETATKLLRPILSDPQHDLRCVRGILAGLVQCRKADPFPILADLAPFNDPMCDNLALLITARHGHPLTADQLEQLAELVRGAGGFSPHIRLQAAWSYLARTGQANGALAAAIGDASRP